MTDSNTPQQTISLTNAASNSGEQTKSKQLYQADEALSPTITVERDSLPIAIQHGMELWWDGSTPTKRLDERDGSSKFTRFVNARIEGKLAEVAFSNLLDRYFDCQSAVDWRIYGEYTQTDDGDLQHLIQEHVADDGTRTYEEYPLAVDIDIKKTKPWNSWLAIRREIFNHIGDDAPIVLSKLRIENDIQLDQWQHVDGWDDVDADGEFRDRLLEFSDAEFPLKVEFVGAVYKDEFTDYFEKGEHLYDPETGRDLGQGLKRPNHGVHVDKIPNTPTRWNRVVADLTAAAPADIWEPLCVVDDRNNTGGSSK